MLNWPSKDIDSVLSYEWSPPNDGGDTLASASINLISGTVDIESQTVSGNRLLVLLSGGSVGALLFRGVWVSGAGLSGDEYIASAISDNTPIFAVPVFGVAVFDYALWSASYPELASAVSEPLAAALFRRAGLFLNNTDASPVADVETRLDLLNLIVAHLAVLGGAGSPDGASGLVGRVTSAKEGDVSVETDAGPSSASSAWWLQTTYGFQYWQATASYRTMRYLPGPVPQFERPYWSYRHG